MKIQQFLEHHGIRRNPFAEEDAQTDVVFKEHCIASTYHPIWDKIYGDPHEPSTSIVFGEKGSGKTALRLQIARHIRHHNRQHPNQQLFVIHYDDMNPFLDRFRSTLGRRHRRRADRVLREWKLWDHMDAILSLGVTGLVDRLLGVRQPSGGVEADLDPAAADRLDRDQARDLLLLAACYDQSTSTTFRDRWHALRKRLRFSNWSSYGPLAAGISGTLLMLVLWGVVASHGWTQGWVSLLALLLIAISWKPWLWQAVGAVWLARCIRRQMRLSNRDTPTLRAVLSHFTAHELAAQPLPTKDSTDDRYEMLMKLQACLQTLGFRGIIVLMDRLDEPHLINGSAELMKALLWPILDNKFLKHPGFGLKIMAPIELTRFVDREDREFYQRARLDKQNMVESFQWTGEALYDVASARLAACAMDEQTLPTLRQLIDPAVSDRRIVEALRLLRTPRHLFKFLYRLFVQHCNSHVEGQESWEISAENFESMLALYQRDQDAFDRGLGAG